MYQTIRTYNTITEVESSYDPLQELKKGEVVQVRSLDGSIVKFKDMKISSKIWVTVKKPK